MAEEDSICIKFVQSGCPARENVTAKVGSHTLHKCSIKIINLRKTFLAAKICLIVLDPILEAGKLVPFSIMVTLANPFDDKNCWKRNLHALTTNDLTRKYS